MLLQLTAVGWVVDNFMDSKDKFKFVIIGTGNISGTYYNAIKNVDEAEVAGFISRSLKIPSYINSSDNIEITDSLKNIKSNYDAVIICTPNAYHHTNAIAAAELGKHVLTEKPLDITIEAMNAMINKCREKNVKLGVAYQRRLSGDNPLIKKLIEEKKLGRIFSIDLSVKNYRDDNYYNSSPYRGTYLIDGGGPFIQQASHYIDLYCWLFGKPDKIVSKVGTFVHNIETEDHGAAIFLHNNGMIGTITASTATKPGFPAKLEIYSDKGYAVLENDEITKWDFENVPLPNNISIKNEHTGAATHFVNDTSNHKKIIVDFIKAVKENSEPLINGEEGKITTEVVLEIYKNQMA